jgi:hypothetical protein
MPRGINKLQQPAGSRRMKARVLIHQVLKYSAAASREAALKKYFLYHLFVKSDD